MRTSFRWLPVLLKYTAYKYGLHIEKLVYNIGNDQNKQIDTT